MPPFAPLARRPRARREGRGRPGPGGLIRGCLIFTLRALCIKAFASGGGGHRPGLQRRHSERGQARGRRASPADPAELPGGDGPGLARRPSGRDSGSGAGAEGKGSGGERAAGSAVPGTAAPGAQLGSACLPAASFGGIDLQPRLPFVNVCPAGGGGAGPRVPPHRAGPAPQRARPGPAEPPPRPRSAARPPPAPSCALSAVCLF